MVLDRSNPAQDSGLPAHFHGLDLTGLFCTSWKERLSKERNGKDAEEDVYAGASCREAAVGRSTDRTRPDGCLDQFNQALPAVVPLGSLGK